MNCIKKKRWILFIILLCALYSLSNYNNCLYKERIIERNSRKLHRDITFKERIKRVKYFSFSKYCPFVSIFLSILGKEPFVKCHQILSNPFAWRSNYLTVPKKLGKVTEDFLVNLDTIVFLVVKTIYTKSRQLYWDNILKWLNNYN